MSQLMKFFAGFGVIGLIAGIGLLVFAPIALTIYGLVLAFKASLILGILAMVIEPTPFALGVLALFGHPEVAKQLAHWLGL